MGEKSKNTIIDIIKSDEVRAYIEKLLHEQTVEIISSFNAVDEKRLQEDMQELETQLTQAEELYNGTKKRVIELEMSCGHTQDLLDEKTKSYDDLSERYEQLANKLAICDEQNEKLSTALEEERTSAKEKLAAWEKERVQLVSKIDEYEKKYACINSVYNSYHVLPEKVKLRMGNIFVNDNLYSMIVAVSDWNSIEGIWGFTKRRIIEEENEGINELVNLFMAAFRMFSLIDGSGRYELISPKIGERYDSDRHSIKGVKTDGTIEKVLLSGIYDSVSNKAVFKAVVQIQ